MTLIHAARTFGTGMITPPADCPADCPAACPAAAPSALSDSPRFIPDSPYPDQLLDLDALDQQTGLMARALVGFDRVRDDFATASYADSFNLVAVVDRLRRLVSAASAGWRRQHFFVVAFRSRIPPETDYGDLSRLDEDAHREALASGGLLRYWFTTPDANGRNLATCVWHAQADARAAGRLPQHLRAASAVRDLYSEWRIERYRLDIFDNVSHWEIVEWED